MKVVFINLKLKNENNIFNIQIFIYSYYFFLNKSNAS